VKVLAAKALCPAPDPGITKEILPELSCATARASLAGSVFHGRRGARALLDPLPNSGETTTDPGLAEFQRH